MAKYGRWQKPFIQGKYPHLLALDAVVWSKYLSQHAEGVKRVQYDVWCGKPMKWPEGSNPVQNQAEGCSCKRVDAIYEDLAGHLHLCEIKPYANYVAFGQVQMYRDLMRAEDGAMKDPVLHIVCFSADPDILPSAAKQEIIVDEVGFPESL